MAKDFFRVEARYDEDAGVWFVYETDIPGLATEAETMEAFSDKVLVMARELVELNAHLIDDFDNLDVPLQITAQKEMALLRSNG